MGKKTRVKFYIGTSGWFYPHWQGIFYPQSLKPNQWLFYYSQNFNTVELNATFYRLPPKRTIFSWYEKTPKDFIFSVKVSRYITHIKRLKNCQKEWSLFFAYIQDLKEKLGPFLFQLPPSFKKDLKLLRDFLKTIKKITPLKKQKLAFEFRHPSWLSEDVFYFFQRQKNLSFCLIDAKDWSSPDDSYGGFVYVRFHGPGRLYASDYSKTELKRWAQKIKRFLSQEKDVYVYFNNDFSGFALQDARIFSYLLENIDSKNKA